jgi:hypothetical protein
MWAANEFQIIFCDLCTDPQEIGYAVTTVLCAVVSAICQATLNLLSRHSFTRRRINCSQQVRIKFGLD